MPTGTIVGTWDLKFDNGVKGGLVVDKNKATIDIPRFFNDEGGTGDRGDYVEFFMTGKNNARLFVFGYVKGTVLDGKVQDKAPCEDLKKNLGDLVKIINTCCQVPFKATKNRDPSLCNFIIMKPLTTCEVRGFYCCIGRQRLHNFNIYCLPIIAAISDR